MEFDHNGHAFVLQFPGYPHGDQEGSILKLTDDDGDGTYESAQTFAENLGLASSFMAWRDGFLVAAVPDLLFIRDEDGDGIADEREVLISGFKVGNQQHNVNGLIYTLDNCILLANGYNGGKVHWAESPEDSLDMSGHDLKIDLFNQTMELLARTSGGHEIALDDYGHIFVTHNTDYLQHIVFPSYYLPDRRTDPAHALEDIGQYEANGLGRIFPIGAQESRLNHPEQAGYFSGACGIFHYGGGVFPEEFSGNIFVADVVTNLIHRNRIVEHESSFRGKRVREDVEFLASTDRHFRPVTINSGPDGTMYIMDMHREVIEHPEWIPDKLEKEMDLTAGMDQGRIYQVSPRTPQAKAFVDFAGLQTDPVQYLGHVNQWVRTTAQRLVVTSGSETYRDPLRKLAQDQHAGLARLHALWCLEGLGALDIDLVVKAMQADKPYLVESALQLSEHLDMSEEIRSQQLALISHGNPRVRMQAVLTLGSSLQGEAEADPLVSHPLADLMIRDLDDPYLQLALQTLPLPYQADLLKVLWKNDDQAEGRSGLISILSRTQLADATENSLQLFDVANLPRDREGLAATLRGVQDLITNQSSSIATSSIQALLIESERTGDLSLLASASALRKHLGLPFSEAYEKTRRTSEGTVLDHSTPIQTRIDHLDLLALSDRDLSPLYHQILSAAHPPELQIAAMAHLDNGATARDVPEILCTRWAELDPTAKQLAGDILLYTKYYQKDLLTAFEEGTISLGEMNMHLERRRQLLFSEDDEIRTRAEALFDDSGILQRAEAIEAMSPMLDLKGVAQSGAAVYTRLCAQCHQVGNKGYEVGPDLSGSNHKSKQALMHDILDPNAGCETSYLAYSVTTTDEKVYSGIIANNEAEGVTLILQGGAEKYIARSSIKTMKTSGISFMPEGLEASMNHQEMADLIAYLQGN